VKQLRSEATDLKETLAELLMENHLLLKSVIGDGGAIYEIFGLGVIRDYQTGRSIQSIRQADAQAA